MNTRLFVIAYLIFLLTLSAFLGETVHTGGMTAPAPSSAPAAIRPQSPAQNAPNTPAPVAAPQPENEATPLTTDAPAASPVPVQPPQEDSPGDNFCEPDEAF